MEESANPSLGVTIDMEKLEAACNSAKQNPAEENVFRQLRLCQWTKQTVRWMPMEKWDACAQPVDVRLLEGRPCYAGLDLSSTTDLTSLVLVFPPQEEGEPYQVLPYFWVPDETMDLRVRRDHVNYDLWARQDYIKTTEGNVVVRTDPAGNIKMDKSRATERIDGAVALVMALDRTLRCGGAVSVSVYEDRGLLYL